MDVKKEDKSEQSKKDHIVYYKSLNKIILKLHEERKEESDSTIQRYLDGRINAVEQDRKRIKKMFPDVSEEEWN
jgi:uncharacterized protein YicC (UPF0701 family)